MRKPTLLKFGEVDFFFFLLYSSSHTNALLEIVLIEALGKNKKDYSNINLF